MRSIATKETVKGLENAARSSVVLGMRETVTVTIFGQRVRVLDPFVRRYVPTKVIHQPLVEPPRLFAPQRNKQEDCQTASARRVPHRFVGLGLMVKSLGVVDRKSLLDPGVLRNPVIVVIKQRVEHCMKQFGWHQPPVCLP